MTSRAVFFAGTPRRRLGGALLVLLFAEAARAADAPPAQAGLPDTVTLTDVLTKAKSASARLAADRALVAIVEGEREGAGVYPNPSLAYSNATVANGANLLGGSQHTATVQVPVHVGGQRGTRIRAADARVNVARDEADAAEAELMAQARGLFTTLLVQQSLVTTLEATQDDLRSIRKSVGARAEAGFKSHYDVMRLDAELAVFGAQVEEARSTSMAISGALASLLGIPAWHPQAVGEPAPLRVTLEMPALWDEARARHPLLKRAQASEVAAHASLAVAYAERWPDLVFSAGAMVTTNEYSLAPIVGLAWTLPVFDRNQGTIAASLAGERAAALQTRAAEIELYNTLDTAVRVLHGRLSQLDGFERDVLARLPELRQLAEVAYRNGQATILELLDAIRTQNEQRVFHLSLIGSVMQAEIDVLKASGKVEWIP
jgi:outer membrane protein, heavy metal efflux system